MFPRQNLPQDYARKQEQIARDAFNNVLKNPDSDPSLKEALIKFQLGLNGKKPGRKTCPIYKEEYWGNLPISSPGPMVWNREYRTRKDLPDWLAKQEE